MRQIRLLILSAIAYFVLCPIIEIRAQDSTSDAPEKVFNASAYELENGMQVVVIPNHRVPVVTHMVWYRVGAADEPRGQSGIAHFLEHLMFKGSDGLAPGEFSRIVKSLGGQDNAFTSQDYTAYFQSISKDHLETVMRMESGRMRGMNPPLEDVESERKVVLEERSQRTDNNPPAKFSEHVNSALYVNHPYGIPVIGWRHEIEALEWDAVKAFYDLYYAPNNAILVVSGDVEPDDVFALAQTYYGPLKPEDIPARTLRTTSPPLAADMMLSMQDASIKQESYQSLYRVPSCRQNKQDCLALQVLEQVMSAGSASRLYDSLVSEQKIASSAGLSYRGESWDDSTLYIYATPKGDANLEDVENALDDELRRIIKDGVSAQEMDDAIASMQAEAIYARDSVAGPAMVIGYSLVTGSTLDDIEYWPREIAQITAEQVQDVARRFLDPDNSDLHNVRGVMLPEDSPQVEEQQ